jgi:hypothetical protein
MNAYLCAKSKETRGRQSFGKDIGELLLSRNVGYLNSPSSLVFTNDMIRDVDVLGVLMLLRISNEADGLLVV